MDHNQIEQFDLVDRYLLGKLTTEEMSQFEEHFVDCPQCTDLLKTTGSFLVGLRAATARQASHSGIGALAGPSSSFARFFASNRLILAGAGLAVLLAAGAVFVVNQIGRSRSEADRARAIAAQWESRFDEQERSAAAFERDSRAREEELSVKIRQLEAAKTQRSTAGLAKSGGWSRPMINLRIVRFTSFRGGVVNPSPAPHESSLSASDASFIALDLEAEEDRDDYCVTILTERNQFKWKSCGFKPDEHNRLSLGLPPNFLSPGRYRFVVDGVTKDSVRSIATYLLRFVKRP